MMNGLDKVTLVLQRWIFNFSKMSHLWCVSRGLRWIRRGSFIPFQAIGWHNSDQKIINGFNIRTQTSGLWCSTIRGDADAKSLWEERSLCVCLWPAAMNHTATSSGSSICIPSLAAWQLLLLENTCSAGRHKTLREVRNWCDNDN